METKTHWKKNFDIDYLGAYSLPDGKDMILTIKSLKKEIVKGTGGKKQELLVCHFTENQKPMILNRTNCKTITKIHGTPYQEDWIGKKIQIYTAQVDAFGDITDALRIRDSKPVETIDNRTAIAALNNCESLEELQRTYLSFSKGEQADAEVLKLKNSLKDKLTKKAA